MLALDHFMLKKKKRKNMKSKVFSNFFKRVPQGNIKIGALFPLSGDISTRDGLMGILLAVDDIKTVSLQIYRQGNECSL